MSFQVLVLVLNHLIVEINIFSINLSSITLKDGEDEKTRVCGNFYGSNAMFNADKAEGERLRKEQILKYNYTFRSDVNECRKSLLNAYVC